MGPVMVTSSVQDDTAMETLESVALKLLLSNRVVEQQQQQQQQQEQQQESIVSSSIESSSVSLSSSSPSFPDNSLNDQEEDHQEAHNTKATTGYAFPSPCQPAHSVQESTSTLLAARAYAKAGRSDYAWEALDSLLAAQGSNGFIPKYRYSPSSPTSSSSPMDSTQNDRIASDNDNHDVPYYIAGTAIPNWKLFGSMPEEYLPPKDNIARTLGIRGSGRVSAIPFHGTAILEIFYQSDQTKFDVTQLQLNFDRVYEYHRYIHTAVLRGCTGGHTVEGAVPHDGVKTMRRLNGEDGRHYDDTTNNKKNVDDAESNSTVPCYNILHPWESAIELHSPIWGVALQPVIEHVQKVNWTVGFDLPKDVTEAFDYPNEEVYTAMMFLIGCVSNVTATCKQGVTLTVTREIYEDEDPCDDSTSYEDQVITRCPFAMFDVGYAAALSQSDLDLLKVAEILTNKNSDSNSLKSQIDHLTIWRDQSTKLLLDVWNEMRVSFLSNTTVFTPAPNHTFAVKSTEPLIVPVGYNFMASWEAVTQPTMMDSMSFQLLQHEGPFSFDCGSYPLWSLGGCTNTSANNSAGKVPWASSWNNGNFIPSIYPTLNYLVSVGMTRNNALGIGHYLVNSTLNLICGLPNVARLNFTAACNVTSVNFARAYNALTGHPVSTDACGMSSTEAAAVVYNMLVQDKPFDYVPAPPLRSSWVIVIITAELVVAFSIGVACLVMSLNLLRRLKADDDGDAFVRMLRSPPGDPADLYGADAFFSCDSEGGSLTDGGDVDQGRTSTARRRIRDADDEMPSRSDYASKFAYYLNPLNYIHRSQ